MNSFSIFLVFGLAYLVISAFEFRVAFKHAAEYRYKPALGAAYYWLIAGASFLLIAAAIGRGE